MEATGATESEAWATLELLTGPGGVWFGRQDELAHCWNWDRVKVRDYLKRWARKKKIAWRAARGHGTTIQILEPAEPAMATQQTGDKCVELSDIEHLIQKAKRRQSGVDVIRLNGMIEGLKCAVENTQKREKEAREQIGKFAAKKGTYDGKLMELRALAEFVDDKGSYTQAIAKLEELSIECELEIEKSGGEVEQFAAEIASNQHELEKLLEERAQFPAEVRANVRVEPEALEDVDSLVRMAEPLRKRVANDRLIVVGGVPGRMSSQVLLAFLEKALKPRRIDWPDIGEDKALAVVRNKSAECLVMFTRLLPAGKVVTEARRMGVRVAMSEGMSKRVTLDAIARAYGIELLK